MTRTLRVLRSAVSLVRRSDNLFNGGKGKSSLRLTAVNITNKYALYNFLSTFSGTRALTAEVGFHF